MRVITQGITFSDILKHSFDRIRSAAQGHPEVLIQLLSTIQEVANVTEDPERRGELCRHASYIGQTASLLEIEHEREAVNKRLREVAKQLIAPGSGG